MPGFKPRADLAFRDIRIAVIRLTNASETPQQHQVIRNLLNGVDQIEPLWGIKPGMTTKRRKGEQIVHMPGIVGQASFDKGLPREANPHEKGSDDYFKWDQGWCIRYQATTANQEGNHD